MNTILIPLSQLKLSKLNARRTDRKAGLDELKASIAAHGLQQNLVVVEGKKKGSYEVVAGGRRLAALGALRKEGQLPIGYAVPCHLVSADDTREVSLAENIVRTAMHPYDQYAVWRTLAEQGQTAEHIARRFGASEATVTKRLKLARVAPDLLEAYRDGEMSLEQLEAFTLTDDHDRQREVWQSLKNGWNASAASIRKVLTEHAVSSRHRLARFVGVEAYEAAGGAVTRDLFSEGGTCYLDDPLLLQRLVVQKLEAAAADYQGRWKWTRIVVEGNGGYDYHRFDHVYPVLQEVPQALTDELDALATRYNAGDYADDEERAALVARHDEVEAEIEKYCDYTPEDRARAGCILTVSPNGELFVHEGLTDPEDAEQEEAADEPDADPTPKGYSKALIDDLTRERHRVMQVAIAQEPGIAFDLLLYALCRETFRDGEGYPLHLSIRPEPGTRSRAAEAPSAAEKRLADIRATLPLEWLHKPEVEAFESLCALKDRQKRVLLAYCVAHALKAQQATTHGKSEALEAAAARSGVSVANYWRPTAGGFLSRINKRQLLEIGGYVHGEAWGSAYGSTKKPILVDVMDDAFAPEPTRPMPEDARERAASWLPEGMAFAAAEQEIQAAS